MKNYAGIRWIFLLVAVLGGLGKAATGQIAYARLMYVSLLLLLVSFVWSVFSLRGVKLHREARVQRASVGDIFEEHYEISSGAWLGCAWLEVANQSTLPLASGSRLITRIGPRKKRFYSARSLLVKRGAYPLGPTSLSSGDPFGLFSRKRLIPANETLVVLPMTVDISTFPPPEGLLPGGKMIRQKTMDVTPHAAGVREYVPGDPMKRIHWKSTARRGRFMVKEFEQDPQSDIWLFLDAQCNYHYNKDAPLPDAFNQESFILKRPKVTLPCDSFEYAVSAVASLARFFLTEKRAVGLACASRHFTIMSAERGERQLGKILETLAFIKADGAMPMLGLVTMQAKLLPLGSAVMLFTSAANADLLSAIEVLQRKNLIPMVVLFGGDSFGGKVNNDELLIDHLLKCNIPLCKIDYGDDLGSRLALPATYYQKRYNSRLSYDTTA